MTAQSNTMWQKSVRDLFAEGLGSRDIAVKLKCDVLDVRRELWILRESGKLPKIKAGPTVKRLMIKT